jgi:SAM-dependent methyltransferase
MSDVITYETSFQADSGARPTNWLMMPPRRPYKIYLGQPNAGSIMPPAAASITHASRRHNVNYDPRQFGDIEHNFNMLWCDALNNRASQGFTHFAMIHSDIGTEWLWLDTLIDEMDHLDADVMTTVIPIKDNRGLTTTGIRYAGVWGTRRFTMREIMRLPETFCVADTDEPNEILAINTGLWVCRLPMGGWPDKFPGFTCKHKIEVVDGQFSPSFDSEDWLFSDWLATQGLKVYATRKVKAFHRGGMDYSNINAWGTWETELQRPSRPLGDKLRNRPSPQITVETGRPIALDSLDHTQPLGAANDNSLCYAFNRKLFDLVPAGGCRVLDLGCSGGAFVRSVLEAGGFAVGIDGSDFSLKAKRAEWATIPDYLFTADVTAPFTIRNCTPEAVRFNVFSAWEFFEHTSYEQLWDVLENVKRHAEPGALLISSISASVEPHHLTSEGKDWWIKRISECGFEHAPDLEDYFGEDLVRGSNRDGAVSRSVIFRCHAATD